MEASDRWCQVHVRLLVCGVRGTRQRVLCESIGWGYAGFSADK